MANLFSLQHGYPCLHRARWPCWYSSRSKKHFSNKKILLAPTTFSPRKKIVSFPPPQKLLPFPNPNWPGTPFPEQGTSSPNHPVKRTQKYILFLEKYPFPWTIIFITLVTQRTAIYQPMQTFTSFRKNHKYMHWWSENEIPSLRDLYWI